MRAFLAAAMGLMLFVGACGGNGDDTGSGDLDAFCDRAAALDDLERHPTDGELDDLLESAPDEVRDEVEILVDSAREFRAGNEEAADTPEIQNAGTRFDEYVDANC